MIQKKQTAFGLVGQAFPFNLAQDRLTQGDGALRDVRHGAGFRPLKPFQDCLNPMKLILTPIAFAKSFEITSYSFRFLLGP